MEPHATMKITRTDLSYLRDHYKSLINSKQAVINDWQGMPCHDDVVSDTIKKHSERLSHYQERLNVVNNCIDNKQASLYLDLSYEERNVLKKTQIPLPKTSL